VKKIIIYLYALFSFNYIAISAETGGMPQLNPEFWFSQIFWLTITFGILYTILSKFILPKIRNNLETRKSQIMENIEIADNQKTNSEKNLKEYDKIILDAKDNAKKTFNLAKGKVQLDLGKEREKIESELNSEIEDAENEIKDLKKSSPEKISLIAVDTAAEIIQKLIGVEVNKSNVSAIVSEQVKLMKGK
jgi:F-type H+-transporting ATPase subunit b